MLLVILMTQGRCLLLTNSVIVAIVAVAGINMLSAKHERLKSLQTASDVGTPLRAPAVTGSLAMNP